MLKIRGFPLIRISQSGNLVLSIISLIKDRGVTNHEIKIKKSGQHDENIQILTQILHNSGGEIR